MGCTALENSASGYIESCWHNSLQQQRMEAMGRMTTNVRDSNAFEMATDSRWTIDLRPYGRPMIIGVDDVDYQKIITVDGKLLMFGGNSKVINAWKQAISLNAHYPKSVNVASLPTDGMAISIVSLTTCELIIEKGYHTVPDGASFAGTGYKDARLCWLENRDARRAVESAMKADFLTGGTVRFFNYSTGIHNLAPDRSFEQFNSEFLRKGFVMYTDTSAKLPIAEAAAQDNHLHEVINKVSAGELAATAPCDPSYDTWSQADKEQLHTTMRELFNFN